MTNLELLDKAVELNHAFYEIYNKLTTEGGKRPVIGVSDSYVQMTVEAFAEMFQGYDFKLFHLASEVNPYELSVNYKGVNFIALCTRAEFSRLF